MNKTICFFKKIIFVNVFLLLGVQSYSQYGIISGYVSNNRNTLSDCNVSIVGTSTGVRTDINGYYELIVSPGTYKVNVQLGGYIAQEASAIVVDSESTELNFTLRPGTSLDNDNIGTGSKSNKEISQFMTPMPVDVITADDISNSSQFELGQILQYLVPTFHSTYQTIADGTDHVDPAMLKGLGPDQILLLINGKRWHSSSLVHVNGTVGRGSAGVDINSIPTTAIQRIEILRDGAAAQYGSDAIGGVINIILKEKTGVASISTQAGITTEEDGEKVKVGANYGLGIGSNGFFNITGEFIQKGSVNRSGDYTGKVFGNEQDNDLDNFFASTGYKGKRVMEIGNAATQNGSVFINCVIPIEGGVEIYSHAGFTYRSGEAAGFYRFPYDSTKVVHKFYPNGFSPRIHTDNNDFSFVGGIRGKMNGWYLDFSNNRGSNVFGFTVENTNNASLGASTPFAGYAGGFKYAQNITNLDITREIKLFNKPSYLAFGGELRIENYSIEAGEQVSWIDGGELTNSGEAKQVGFQLYPGYKPKNELNKYRSNVAAYAELQSDITEKFLIVLASRFESFIDFGSNIGWKVASRYKFADWFVLRGGYNTGFRAPSLHQLYYNKASTQIIDGKAVEVMNFNNESSAVREFGIKQLKPELSQNLSFGFTSKIKNIALTFDAYQIDIQDRIVLSGRFKSSDDPKYEKILSSLNVSQAQFFTNAINTKTQGVDIMFSYSKDIANSNLTLSLGYNASKTEVIGDIKTSDMLNGKEDILFNREEISRVEVAQPKSKAIFLANYDVNKFNVKLRATRFGEVEYIHPSDGNPDNWQLNEISGIVESRDQIFEAKIITDFDFGYRINNNLRLSIGGNNLFNIYPDKHKHSSNISSGRFIYSRRVQQFGVAGAFYYLKFSFKL